MTLGEFMMPFIYGWFILIAASFMLFGLGELIRRWRPNVKTV